MFKYRWLSISFEALFQALFASNHPVFALKMTAVFKLTLKQL